MSRVAGVDGCRGGWVIVERTVAGGEVSVRVEPQIRTVLHDERLVVVGIDIPIGLLDRAQPGGRECDRRARKFLGGARASSVFSPPVRAVLGASGYEDAKERSRRSSEHEIALSQQCFAIVAKIAEVDQLMTPGLQQRVVEVHPEVSFATLNGDRSIALPKQRSAGRAARAALLAQALGIDVLALVAQHRSRDVQADDILDAMVACWTADRVLARQALRFPEDPPVDSRGLRMEIVR
jgi:predicted RNase H-like nuclease